MDAKELAATDWKRAWRKAMKGKPKHRRRLKRLIMRLHKSTRPSAG